MTKSYVGIPTGVHVLLERSGKVLMMRRAGTGFFDGMFSLPGGHVEPGESLRETAIRELAEETGLVVMPPLLDYVGVVHRMSDTNRIDFFLRAKSWQGEAVIREPHKCDRLDWMSVAELPEHTVPYIREALLQSVEPWVIESGWCSWPV